MPSLNRIILINTHMTGVVELNLDGHTNICGTNASGKTTLQRLIPVFYGEYPSRVVPATRDSFEKWYLPQLNSYIIYEYKRGDENEDTTDATICQVVLTSSGKGVDYRIINKSFNIEDYLTSTVTGEQHAIAPTELVKNIKRDGVLCTRKLNTKEFKAVIQNDRSILGSSRDLTGFARLFSLCEHNKNLRHIEKLAKAVHSKEGKMETIKAMVAAILEEDGITPGETKLSPTKIDEWIRECKLIKGFDEIRPEYVKLEQAHSDFNQINHRLAELKHQLGLDISRLAADKVELEALIEQAKFDLNHIEQTWAEQRDGLNQSYSAAKSDVDNYESKLDKVEEEYDKWQDKNIDTLKDNLEQLPRWQSELSSAESRLTLLTDQHQDIESRFNKQLLDIKERNEQEREAYAGQKDELKERRIEHLAAQNSQLSELSSRFAQERSALEGDFKGQQFEIEADIKQLSTLLRSVGYTQQEQQQLDMLESAIIEATELEDVARSKLRQANDDLHALKTKRQNVDAALQQARKKVSEKQQRVTDVNAMLYPGQGSLLEFLRLEQPGWEENLGKVINPALLNRTDLNPTVSEQGNTSFSGVELDLAKLTIDESCANESELQDLLSEAEAQLELAMAEQDDIEAQLMELSSQVRNAELSLAKAQTETNNTEANRKRATQDKAEANQEFQNALRERKQHYQKQVAKRQSDLATLQSQRDEAVEDLLDQQREAEMELKTHWQTLINEVEQQIAQVESHLAQCQSQLKTEIKQLDKWQQDELANRGVDIDDIGSLKKKITQLKDAIKNTEKDRHLVLEFNVWYQTNYVDQKVNWQNQLAQAKQLESQSKRELDKGLAQYKQSSTANKQRLAESEKSLKSTLEQEQQAQLVIAQLKKLKLTEVSVSADSGKTAQRISEASSLMAQREDCHNAIRHYIERFDQKIAAQSGTGFYDAWERSREACSRIDEEGNRQLDPVRLVPELDQLINGLVPQKLNSIREQGRIFGLALSEYYKILKDIEQHIGQQSSRISKEVDEELFLDGVSDSAVVIRSKVSELEFWPDLQKFNELYNEWISNGAHTLPDEEYAYSMRRVIDILGRAALSGGISKLLDIELHIKESGRDLVIRTDRQLNESSSHGMAYLILCKFLLAFTRLLRGDSKAIIHWPIDELGTLHQTNIKKIFDACQNNQIHVVGAFPNPESEVLTLFKNRYLIDKQKRQLQVVEPKVSAISTRISERLKQSEAKGQTSQVAEEVSA